MARRSLAAPARPRDARSQRAAGVKQKQTNERTRARRRSRRPVSNSCVLSLARSLAQNGVLSLARSLETVRCRSRARSKRCAVARALARNGVLSLARASPQGCASTSGGTRRRGGCRGASSAGSRATCPRTATRSDACPTPTSRSSSCRRTPRCARFERDRQENDDGQCACTSRTDCLASPLSRRSNGGRGARGARPHHPRHLVVRLSPLNNDESLPNAPRRSRSATRTRRRGCGGARRSRGPAAIPSAHLAVTRRC